MLRDVLGHGGGAEYGVIKLFVVTSSLSPLPPSLSLRADNGGAADGAVVRGNA
jgi:hypothetical protein